MGSTHSIKEIQQERTEEIFGEALDLSGEARGHFLSRACERDFSRRVRVERLLSADADARNFLDSGWAESAMAADAALEPYPVPTLPDRPTPIPKIVGALRNIALLAGLTDVEFNWLATHGKEYVFSYKALLFREGEHCSHMTFMLRGEIHIVPHKAGSARIIRSAGQIAGLLPFSRMKTYGGDGTIAEPAWVLNIHKDLFPEMLIAIPSIGQRCVGAMLDSVRQITHVEHHAKRLNAVHNLTADISRHRSTDCLGAGDIVSKRFQIVRRLGDGGMAQVYQAYDTELDVQVALKIIRPEISSRPEILARFRREVRIAQRVTHPNVCRTFHLDHELRQVGPDVDDFKEMFFLTMEYLDGETLRQLLKRRGILEPYEAAFIARQMAEALSAAHQSGIIHRDIKPSNVMIVSSNTETALIDRVVITDFGLAKLETLARDNDATSISEPGCVMGTLAYMSPEQLQAQVVTPATDIYSLGLVLYEMVTGAKAFPDPESLAVTFRRIAQPPPSPRTLIPNLPDEWETLVLRCLQIDPANRFQHANDVIAVLDTMGQKQAL
jgi:tRNA A-37 threonylcarbamoyl transferase component Bud32